MLTDLEKEVIETSCKLHNLFCQLPAFHPSDIKDECYHVHAIQNFVMAREAYRSNPELFPVKGAGNKPIDSLTTGSIKFTLIDPVCIEVNSISPREYFIHRFYKRVIHWFRIRSQPV